MARAAPPQLKAGKQPARTARAPPIVQPKLDIGPAHDRWEAEADRIADRIMAGGQQAPRGAPPTITPLRSAAISRKSDLAAPQRVPKATAKKDVKTFKVEEEEKEEGKETQVRRSADGAAPAPAAAEASIARMRAGGGKPLPSPVRAPMEAGLGRSLSAVRVHDHSAAHAAAKSVGARAFTVGSDVFFGAGRYRPETAAGQRLLAHELVHTQQQKALGGAAQRMPLQRDGDDPVGEQITQDEEEEQGPGLEWRPRANSPKRIVLDPGGTGGTIYLPDIKIPTIQGGTKGESAHPIAPGLPDVSANFHPITSGQTFVYTGKNPRGSDTARQQFLRNAYFQAAETEAEATLYAKLPEKVENWTGGAGIRREGEGADRYYLHRKRENPGRTRSIIIGTQAELADHELIKMPDWNRRGQYEQFDVDHSQELQLGGLDAWANFWLLEASSNRSAGTLINSELSSSVSSVIREARDANFFTGGNAGRAPSFEAIKERQGGWKVEFSRLSGLRIAGGKEYWARSEILAGNHLQHLRAMTPEQVAAEGLILGEDRPSRVSIFAAPGGGYRQRFRVNADGTVTPENGGESLFGGFDLVSADVAEDHTQPPYIRNLNGWVFRRKKKKPFNDMLIGGGNGIPVLATEGLGFSGYLDQATLLARIQALPTEAVGMSPLTFDAAGVTGDGTLFADGRITATKMLFPGLEVPFHVYGTDFYVDFPIPTGALDFGPVSVTEAALQLGYGADGFFISGVAGVEVASVGSGLLTARVEDGRTLISGDFNFDTDFLDPATAGFTYDFGADTLTLRLEAGVADGVLPGVESGRVNATFSREGVSIAGALQLGGVLSGTEVTVGYSREEGLSLGAENIRLPVDNVPGITSATAALYARQNPDSGEWSFGGSGTAELAIAGVTGSLTVAVDGNKVVVSGGPLTVAHGPASGSLSFTATNAPIDEQGNILEGEALGAWTIWGRGSAEITFGRVLRGSAAITLSPDASVQIEGTIGLPPTFDVFERQDFNRDLLHVETPDFPIWGVSLGGVGVGIFAFADADLRFNAFVGPGQLVDTQVTALMDLDAPQDATVTGSARFHVPAGAGLTLDVGGGLRARAAVAFVEGRVGLDCELGIAADASAGVEVAWNRTDGLAVEADVEASARPKFRVGVNASVRAGVDLGLFEISDTWGPWRRTLGEFGPEMEMGVRLPARWSERDGVDFSLADIEVRQPQINVRDILKSSFEELV